MLRAFTSVHALGRPVEGAGPNRPFPIKASAIHRPEVSPEQELNIPIPKLAYTHTSLPVASPTRNGRGTSSHDKNSSMPVRLQDSLLAAAHLEESTRASSGLGSSSEAASTQQLEALAEETLGATSPIWNPNLRKQRSSSILPADELDRLLKQPLDVVYHAYTDFLSQGAFEPALRLLTFCVQSKRDDVVGRLTHRRFMDMASQYKVGKPVLEYLRILPRAKHDQQLYTMALTTIAKARDLDSAAGVLDLAKRHGITADKRLLTAFMKVCKSVGNVDRAYRAFLEIKALPDGKPDGYVYGALIGTCAEAMKRDLEVALERKEQYVLLEKAFQYVADAEAAGVHLEAPVWNSLLRCAGRCGELNRAFEVLEMMQARGVPSDVITYGSLIEACVEAKQPEKARRVFEVALSKGFQSLQLYTQGINACMIPGAVDLEHAMVLYQQLSLKGLKPDKKLFACLMSCAGTSGQVDLAFQLLSDMYAEGLAPTSTTCSGLIHACLCHGNLSVARKVYDLCRQQSVFPVISQFNRLMDWYAKDFRFGEVVSLLTDMTAAGLSPNLNTYRILINACQRAGQAGLAFQIFALMHGNKIKVLQEKFAQTIYYTLIKSCFNQIRQLWATSGANPMNPQFSSGLLPKRDVEADRLLAALGGSRLKASHRSNPFDGPPDTIDWASHAVSAFQHMLSRGHKPTLTLLDMLFSTLRLKRQDVIAEAEDMAVPASRSFSSYDDGDEEVDMDASAGPSENDATYAYEVPFDKRAFQIMEEVMSRGILPRFDPESPLQLDMRKVPPTVAEVYCMSALLTLERRALKLGHTHYHHSFTFLVPPFDPDQIKWPSYVEKLERHYTLHMEDDDMGELHLRLSRQPQHRAASSLAHAAQNQEEASSEGDDSEEEPTSSTDTWDEDSHIKPSSSEFTADSATGLAVAATFRRMKVFMNMDWQRGSVQVGPQEIARWLRRRRRQVLIDNNVPAAAAAAMAASAAPVTPGMQTAQRYSAPGGHVGPAGPSGSMGPGMAPGMAPSMAPGMGGGMAPGMGGPGGKALFDQQRHIRSSSYGGPGSMGPGMGPGTSGRPPLFGGPAGPGASPSSGPNGHAATGSAAQQHTNGSAGSSTGTSSGPSISQRQVTPAGYKLGPAAPGGPSGLKRPRARKETDAAGASARSAEVSVGPGMGSVTVSQQGAAHLSTSVNGSTEAHTSSQ